MPLYSASWEEVIGSLPPRDRAELMTLLAGPRDSDRGEDDTP